MIRFNLLGDSAKLQFTIFLFCSVFVFAQELPPIQNFKPNTYKGENQNWGITQISDKSIYIANNKGLLEYTGGQWVLYKSLKVKII